MYGGVLGVVELGIAICGAYRLGGGDDFSGHASASALAVDVDAHAHAVLVISRRRVVVEYCRRVFVVEYLSSSICRRGSCCL
jgi:hypothetical protein